MPEHDENSAEWLEWLERADIEAEASRMSEEALDGEK